MKACRFFKKIEDTIPLDLAFDGDRVGFIGPGDPDHLDVEQVLVLMDYLSQKDHEGLDYSGYDLLVLHHPPSRETEIPTYVIHSNWDLLHGGACDALAECLAIDVDDVLDTKTGLGRIGNLRHGPVPLIRFAETVMEKLRVNNPRIVNYREEHMVERVGVVSGFGLNPDLIRTAADRDIDLYLSGDLTHPGAIYAKNAGMVLIDATHHATELPGLYRLGELIAKMGLEVQVLDTDVPWHVPSFDRGNGR